MAAGARRRLHYVVGVRDLSPSAFVLRFSREGLPFRPGQWLNLGLPRALDRREYSIYSSPQEPFLEVLVKEIPQGRVSGALRRLRPGDGLESEGPHGGFCLVHAPARPPRYLFVATGTGISPFHCFARRYPGLDYLLLHGVREAGELYDRESFEPSRHVACLSRGPADPVAPAGGGTSWSGATFAGRVTAYLAQAPLQGPPYCYLCGNGDMIYEAFAILKGRGVPRSRIFAELYF